MYKHLIEIKSSEVRQMAKIDQFGHWGHWSSLFVYQNSLL